MSHEILVVGSLAYDSIESTKGKVDRTLGGSANYFSLAASLYAPVRVVGVVGNDYEESNKKLLTDRNVDLAGLVVEDGKTFHWEGSYVDDINEAKTLKTELNVFENFKPNLPDHYRDSDFVFLANIEPSLQLDVLSQVESPKWVGCDTMNFWIDSRVDVLKEVLKKVDVLLINEEEAKSLTKTTNAIEAAGAISELGPKYSVIKRGEYGFVLHGKEGFFMLPAFPITEVVDPTGAGDSFAGAFFGYLASLKSDVIKFTDLKKACVHGCLVASHTIEDFGVKSIAEVNAAKVEKRFQEFQKATSIP